MGGTWRSFETEASNMELKETRVCGPSSTNVDNHVIFSKFRSHPHDCILERLVDLICIESTLRKDSTKKGNVKAMQGLIAMGPNLPL